MPKKVEDKNMKLIGKNDKANFLFSYTDFNSMYYWVPIILDNEMSRILMNLNPEDKNYGKLCLQSCNKYDGCCDCFIIYDETITLDVFVC